MDFVSEVIPFYESDLLVHNGTKETIATFNLVDTNKDFYGPFSELRLKDIVDGQAYIDTTLANRLSLKLGDVVSLDILGEILQFTVKGLFEPLMRNDEKNSSIAVSVSDSGLSAALNSISYSAAFVTISDYEKAKHYFDHEYKALGKLMDVEDYNSIEMYEVHKKAILNTDFSLQITDMKYDYESYSKEFGTPSIEYAKIFLGIVLLILLCVIPVMIRVKYSDDSQLFTRFFSIGVGKDKIRKLVFRLLLKNCILVFVILIVSAFAFVMFGSMEIHVSLLYSIVIFLISCLICSNITANCLAVNVSKAKKKNFSGDVEPPATGLITKDKKKINSHFPNHGSVKKGKNR
jgi:hypothetical protein